MLKFPQEFIFGTATAAHQIEGDNVHNDWWYYEQLGKLPYKSGKACNHWELYREDIDLMSSLGYGAYRFSIEWSRIYPKEGKKDEDAIARYNEILKLLIDRGIIPMVTLHHFTLPLWFLKKGGFEKEENLRYWEDYVSTVGDEIKGVRLVASFNEPMVYVFSGYIVGEFPPFKKSARAASKVEANILRAHAMAYEILKEKFQVGIVKNIPVFLSKSQEDSDLKAASKADRMFNFNFLDAIWSGKLKALFGNYRIPEGDVDFLGVNYYTAYEVWHTPNPLKYFLDFNLANIGKRKTDMGWSVYPEGIYKAIEKMYRYEKPIYITENGIATMDDEWRVEFIISHLQYVHRAIENGHNVKGYFYWSFMDNFEWNKGFAPRFGLVEVDYNTFERRPRKSAYIYGEISRERKIKDEILQRYGNIKRG
jgi:beta-glucosidase